MNVSDPSFFRRLLSVAAGLGLTFTALAEITLPADAPECVRWAAGDVRTALVHAGLAAADADLRVTITPRAGFDAQGFTLNRSGTAVTIEAGGPLGAMYGLQEVAEQLQAAGPVVAWSQAAAAIQPTTQRPFLEVRADNMFVHVYPLQLDDLEFWRDYIDRLARNRFNLLDLHGAYDLQSTSFPNLYPMLVHVPDYPQIGDEREQARHLANFAAIIAYAKSRGIRVAFMNYSANDGRAGAEKNAPSITGVPPEKLADYTAKAVTLLLRALPDLAMLGFRVGESGQDAAFYQNAYLKGVVDAGRPDLRLYTRSWQTTKDQLLPIAAIARSGFDIEVKFNGEHLGLPYHALQTKFGTYSYEDYLDVPASYRIIWQVRANGTHRFWTWEDTEFIRRTVRTLALGDARGFTLEPSVAYFDTDPAAFYRATADRAVFRTMAEKYWMWYFAWGRLAYNPDLPEAAFVRAYARHFGAAAGTVYAAVQRAGEIVPLVYAYRFPGPDHRDFSPETETGLLSAKRMGKVPLLLQFIDHHPQDERAFASIGAFVDHLLAQQPDGRVGPGEVAARLRTAALATRQLVAAVPALPEPAAGEWRLLRTDLLSASWLADYYADRIAGLTHFAYALRTGRKADYAQAQTLLSASRDAWRKLSETADAVYRPLSNPLRKQLDFQWGAQLASIEEVDATLLVLWTEHKTATDAPPLILAADGGRADDLRVEGLAHEIAAGKTTVAIRGRAIAPAGVARVVLWFKPLPSRLAWQSVALTTDASGRFATSVPLTPSGLMYGVEVQDRAGHARNFPDVFAETPYRVVPAFPPAP